MHSSNIIYSTVFHVFKLYIRAIIRLNIMFPRFMMVQVVPIHLFLEGRSVPLNDYATVWLPILLLMDIYYLNSVIVNILIISVFGKCARISSEDN